MKGESRVTSGGSAGDSGSSRGASLAPFMADNEHNAAVTCNGGEVGDSFGDGWCWLVQPMALGVRLTADPKNSPQLETR